MRDLLLTFLIGLCAGILAHYKFNKVMQSYSDDTIVHDTIMVDSTIVKDSIITKYEVPKTFVISLDSVSIDTISTVVNGRITDAKYKITIK